MFDYREIVRWAILFLFVLLVTFIVDAIIAPVLTWMSQVLYQAVEAFGLPIGAAFMSNAFSFFGETGFHFAAGGFAYTWLVHVPWRRGALMAWAVLLALRYAGSIGAAAFSPWFYTDAVIAALAAHIGARYFEEHRYNEHLVELRRRLHNRLQLA